MNSKLTSLLCFFLLGPITTIAQRFFTIQVDSLTRSYMVKAPDEEIVRLPMVIILHDSHVRPLSLENLPWNNLRQPAVMVFPIGLLNQWKCMDSEDSLLAERDLRFLYRLVKEVHKSFSTDRSRTFLIGMGDSYCVVQDFYKRHHGLVRSIARWDYDSESGGGRNVIPEPPELDSLVIHNPTKPDSLRTQRLPFEQGSKTFKLYQGHFSFSINLGRWQQASGSRTAFNTSTFVDIAEHHFIFGLSGDYNFTERISTLLDANLIIIPKEERINSIQLGPNGIQVNGIGNGGIIVSYGTGVRYVFPRETFRPFILAALGATYMHIEGGTGSGSSNGISRDITRAVESIFTCRFGAGFDYRLSGDVAFRFSTTYYMSNKITPPIGSIEAFQGLSVMGGLGFLIGE